MFHGHIMWIDYSQIVTGNIYHTVISVVFYSKTLQSHNASQHYCWGWGDGQWEASAGCCRTFPLKAGEEASLRLNYISLRQKPPALRWKKTFSGRILNWTWTHRRAIACWRRPQQGSSWQQTPGFAKLEQHYCNCDGFQIQASGQKDVLTNTRKTTPFRNLHFWFGTPTKRFSWYTLVQHRL